MRVLLLTPRLDERVAVGVIGSRIGLQRPAFAFTADNDLLLHIWREHRAARLHCVLVDEAQFLTPRQVLQLTLVCDRLRIPVLCYGLRTDFRGEPFEGSKYLLAWADELVEIKTICHTGKKATMNARVNEQGQRVVEGEQVCIGHNYVSVSRAEFALDQVSPVGYRCPLNDDDVALRSPTDAQA